jgi:hypothetical protein
MWLEKAQISIWLADQQTIAKKTGGRNQIRSSQAKTLWRRGGE